MARMFFTAVFTALVIMTSGLSGAQAAPQKGKTFDNWGVGCEIQADGKTERCFAQQFQTLNGNNKRVLTVAVGHLGSNRELLVVVLLPLGSNLQISPAFKVDDGPQVDLVYQTCTGEGCRAVVAINEIVLKSLTSGKQMAIGVAPWGAPQAVVISVPLKGLAGALAASE